MTRLAAFLFILFQVSTGFASPGNPDTSILRQTEEDNVTFTDTLDAFVLEDDFYTYSFPDGYRIHVTASPGRYTTQTRYVSSLWRADDVEIYGKSYNLGQLQAVDRNYPDFAEVPDGAHFAETNTSLIFLISAAIALAGLLWMSYRRWFSDIAPAPPAAMPPEELMKSGRKAYDVMDYPRALSFFDRAIKSDPAARNPEAHLYRGYCLHHLDYLCDAIDEWMACYMDDPQGPHAQDALHEARRWRAYQVIREKEQCMQCGAENRLTDLRCYNCGVNLNRTVIVCGVCGKKMVKEAQLCVHCLPDEIKAEVAMGMDWPILKTTTIDWEAQLIKSRLEAEDIPCVLTGEKGSGIPLTVGHLGTIHVRVPFGNLPEAQDLMNPAGSAPQVPG